jgi:hypothetical protein
MGIEGSREISCLTHSFGNIAKAISGGAGLPSIGLIKGVIGEGNFGKIFTQSFGISFGCNIILPLK